MGVFDISPEGKLIFWALRLRQRKLPIIFV
uniref:Uncharacterized protein n=1 Tax=Siphoviridae sp. ctSuy3 TaxID=2827874 RepID=A0A8S5SID0_9CAUD|nr:MAG TPA: hypothetical protein [Siphoviridae sp. ctSuy3]